MRRSLLENVWWAICVGAPLVLWGAAVSPEQDAGLPPKHAFARDAGATPGAGTRMSIAEAGVDADGDGRPDRAGQVVTVAGRAGAGSDQLAKSRLVAALQSDTAGVMLFKSDADAPFSAGDSLVATGVVEHYRGLTQLRLSEYRVVEAPPRPLTPAPIGMADAGSEQYEGRLVQVEGQVVQAGRNRGGHYLTLTDDGDTSVRAYVRYARAEAVDLLRYQSGDRVRVTGLVGQYDPEAPFDDNYQIYPRGPDDLASLGLTAQFYRRAAMAGGAVLAALLLWAGLLRLRVRQRTQEVAQSEARYRRFAEVTREGILFHCEGDIQDTNAPMRTLTGYTGEELRSMHLDDLLVEAREAPRSDGEENGVSPEAAREVQVRRADGTVFDGELHSHEAEHRGEGVRAVVVRDITAQKEHEAGLIDARQAAEAAARAKSSVLNNMSHELRTPLTTIIGFADVLAGEAEGEQEEFARHISTSGERLRKTLDSVLDLARLGAGGETLHLEPIDLALFVRGAASVFEHRVEQKGLSFDVDVPPEAVFASLDEGALHRILDNLLGNAIKFTEAGGVTLRVRAGEEEVRLCVEDTGIGIGEDFQERLFDEFEQESAGFSRSHEGAGLGLSITQQLVTMMNGTIEVESVPGEGTAFTARFPRTAAPAAREATPDDERHTSATAGRLLLVEDNPSTRTLARHLLSSTYEVRCAAAAEEALARAEETAFDIFLLDINLGTDGEGGEELLHRLRAMPGGADVPAVAFTAHALPGDEQRFREAGFEGYVSKPFSREELLEAVASAADASEARA